MTVAELIEKLKTMPQDLPVHVHDDGASVNHEYINAVFDIASDPEWGEVASVVLSVNSQ